MCWMDLCQHDTGILPARLGIDFPTVRDRVHLIGLSIPWGGGVGSDRAGSDHAGGTFFYTDHSW